MQILHNFQRDSEIQCATNAFICKRENIHYMKIYPLFQTNEDHLSLTHFLCYQELIIPLAKSATSLSTFFLRKTNHPSNYKT